MLNADQGDHIVLGDSWTKGSRARAVPITTAEQRAALNTFVLRAESFRLALA